MPACTSPLLPFDREAPCPACGIALEIRRVCREPHPGLVEPAAPGSVSVPGHGTASARRGPEHLDVACPGCGWSGWMEIASAREA